MVYATYSTISGITIALLKKGHPGLRIGNRHDPLTAAFMNGTGT